MAGYKTILFEQDGPAARLTFDRPKVLNALNDELVAESLAALSNVTPDTRVLVLRGSGERAFAASADLEEMQRRMPFSEVHFGARRELGRGLEKAPLVTVAAINGFALGDGLELALACHLRIAIQTAQLGLPEARIGILPANGGTARLTRLVGRGRALRMILLSERIDAEQAERLGIVDWTVGPEDFDAEVGRLTDRLAPPSLRTRHRRHRLLQCGHDA